jgi:hypothetical protein
VKSSSASSWFLAISLALSPVCSFCLGPYTRYQCCSNTWHRKMNSWRQLQPAAGRTERVPPNAEQVARKHSKEIRFYLQMALQQQQLRTMTASWLGLVLLAAGEHPQVSCCLLHFHLPAWNHSYQQTTLIPADCANCATWNRCYNAGACNAVVFIRVCAVQLCCCAARQQLSRWAWWLALPTPWPALALMWMCVRVSSVWSTTPAGEGCTVQCLLHC